MLNESTPLSPKETNDMRKPNVLSTITTAVLLVFLFTGSASTAQTKDDPKRIVAELLLLLAGDQDAGNRLLPSSKPNGSKILRPCC